MKKYLSLLAIILSLGCSDSNDENTIEKSKFRTPEANDLSQDGSSFNGIMIIYPCDVITSEYFGNYKGVPPERTVVAPTYLLGKNGYLKTVPPLLLPLGEYTLIYWGVPNSSFTTYDAPASVEPALTFNRVMKDAVYSLRPTSSGASTYYPAYDYVFGRQEITVGSDPLSVNLKRVTGGLIIYMINSDDTALDASISSVTILISKVAKSLNFYTGDPLDFTATVRFPLTITDERMVATNDPVMLFPTAPTEPASITIEIGFADGSVKKYNRSLTSSINVGNILTVNIKLGEILNTPNPAEFQVDEWSETQIQISI